MGDVGETGVCEGESRRETDEVEKRVLILGGAGPGAGRTLGVLSLPNVVLIEERFLVGEEKKLDNNGLDTMGYV